VPSNLQLLPNANPNYYLHSFSSYSSISEMIGEKGEMEALKLLLSHKKIKFEKLSRN